MTSFVKCFIASGVLLASFINSGSVKAADVLTIGSDAPPLNVEHWVQNGNGKFKPVTKFESGKVYVVEFWATWCGPCVASMPHLAELQTKYADKGVQIVSISDEDLETVESFLKRPVRGQEEDDNAEKKTYRDLTSAYCLTTDPDESSSEDYMRAAGQNGIPTSFIVGKDSKVEWIGHPMELDETLQAVVEGSWDREKFAAEFKAQQEEEMAMQAIYALLQNKKFDEAIEKIDEVGKKNDSMQIKMLKLQVLVATKKTDAAAAHAKELFKVLADTPEQVNMLAWNLYEMANQGSIENGEIIQTSIAAASAAAEKADKDEKASLLDTLAHLHFVKGDLDKAIEIETQAVKLSGDRDREFIEAFLEELQSAKKEAEKKDQSGDK